MALDPTRGEGVFVRSSPDRLVVTWLGLPEIGSTNSNTIQLVLRADGSF